MDCGVVKVKRRLIKSMPVYSTGMLDGFQSLRGLIKGLKRDDRGMEGVRKDWVLVHCAWHVSARPSYD